VRLKLAQRLSPQPFRHTARSILLANGWIVASALSLNELFERMTQQELESLPRTGVYFNGFG